MEIMDRRMKLYKYYTENIEANPYYPIPVRNHNKLFKRVITIQGLKVFQELRHRFIRDDTSLTPLDKSKLGTLWDLYAATNRNPKESIELDAYMLRIMSQVNLKKLAPLLDLRGLTMPNPNYDSKLMGIHFHWCEVLIIERRKAGLDRRLN
jgi:hypothetical protein